VTPVSARRANTQLTLGLLAVVWVVTIWLLLYMVEPGDRPPTFALTCSVLIVLEGLIFGYFAALGTPAVARRVDPAIWPSIGLLVGGYALTTVLTVMIHNLSYVSAIHTVTESRVLPAIYLRAAFFKLAPVAAAMPFLGPPKFFVMALVLETMAFLVLLRGILAVQTIRSAETQAQLSGVSTALLELRAQEIRQKLESLRGKVDRGRFEDLTHKMKRLEERFQFTRRFGGAAGDLDTLERQISKCLDELLDKAEASRSSTVENASATATEIDALTAKALQLMDVREKLLIR
jgi:hypothetical protein